MGETSPSGEIIVDRRSAPRIPFEAKVTLPLAGELFAAVAQNLSPQGAFLASDLPASELDSVILALEIRDGRAPIQLTGRVVRIVEECESTRGFAAEFDGVEDSDTQRILAATGHS